MSPVWIRITEPEPEPPNAVGKNTTDANAERLSANVVFLKYEVFIKVMLLRIVIRLVNPRRKSDDNAADMHPIAIHVPFLRFPAMNKYSALRHGFFW